MNAHVCKLTPFLITTCKSMRYNCMTHYISMPGAFWSVDLISLSHDLRSLNNAYVKTIMCMCMYNYYCQKEKLRTYMFTICRLLLLRSLLKSKCPHWLQVNNYYYGHMYTYNTPIQCVPQYCYLSISIYLL